MADTETEYIRNDIVGEDVSGKGVVGSTNCGTVQFPSSQRVGRMVYSPQFGRKRSESVGGGEIEMEMDMWQGQFYLRGGIEEVEVEGGKLDDGSTVWQEDSRVTCLTVQQLQDQVGVLAENQGTTDDRYIRVRQDNTALTARIHTLEEHIRELEVIGEERLSEEKNRNRELLHRLEHEKTLEIENHTLSLAIAEKEARVLTEEVRSLRAQFDKVREEKEAVEEQLTETQFLVFKELENVRDIEEQRNRNDEDWNRQAEVNSSLVQDMNRELESFKRDKLESEILMDSGYGTDILGEEVFDELPAHINEMETEIRLLRDQNKYFQNSNEELQAQILNKGLEEGRNLLTNQAHNNSLAAEFEAMSENKMRKALKDQQDVNLHLSSYIDNVLLNIMEKYPELLEITNK